MSFSKPARAAIASALVAMTFSTAACVSGVGANQYPRSRAGEVNRVEEATVVAVRQVVLEGDKSIIGPATGAVVGGVAGSQIGGGDEERAIGAVAGAVIGGIAGAAVEKGVKTTRGYAYTVRLGKTGDLVTITQGADIAIPVGAPVFVEYGSRPRVIPR
jgi:outer membrane lipoprotein SlyB